MTITTHANFIPEIWSKEVISAVEQNLVLANLVWRFDADVKNAGDTIHVPNVTNLTAQVKVAGADVNPQANTEGVTNITIDQHREVSFLVEDITKAQSSYDLMSIYTAKAGYAIALAVDDTLAALATGFATNVGTYNTAITTDVILNGIEQLDLNDVPLDGRAFCFRPDVKRDLLDIDRYVSTDFVSKKGVENGKIGELYGVDTYMSTNILIAGTSTSNMLFHKEALALAMQKAPRTQSQYLLEKLGNLVVVDVLYGTAEMRDLFGVEVRT